MREENPKDQTGLLEVLQKGFSNYWVLKARMAYLG
jgi:hypothetical protein